ncbi:hypothetical protein HD594_000042 [Microbacterium thalassium]|uniref:Uncharacterized protein n=1 Tax=Microbacterium thalassium TaxID=362649 RepID=A0A7X0FLM4_9MICO|nr:hypothetical protein [Microbacterium thalassium]
MPRYAPVVSRETSRWVPSGISALNLFSVAINSDPRPGANVAGTCRHSTHAFRPLGHVAATTSPRLPTGWPVKSRRSRGRASVRHAAKTSGSTRLEAPRPHSPIFGVRPGRRAQVQQTMQGEDLRHHAARRSSPNPPFRNPRGERR